MADNTHFYGFRWYSAWNGGKSCPVPIKMSVADDYDGQDDDSASVDINIGDPVSLASTGTVELAAADTPVYGIVVGVHPYWNGTAMQPTSKLPNANNWGSVEQRRPFVDIIPASAGIWEIDCDENTTATTYAAYLAFIGENCNHNLQGNTSQTSADPVLDISDHAVTEGLPWRIVGISGTYHNKDFSGNYVKLLVAANDTDLPMQAATNIVGI